MKASEVEALVRGMAPVIKQFVSEAVAAAAPAPAAEDDTKALLASLLKDIPAAVKSAMQDREEEKARELEPARGLAEAFLKRCAALTHA